MRILVLCDSIPPEHLGGAGKVAWEVARGLRAAGHEVALIATTPGTPFADLRDGIATHHLHSAYPYRFNAWLGLYNPQTMPALRRLYAAIQPDAIYAVNVHTHLSYSSLSLARRLRIPVVFHAQDVMPFAYAKLDYAIAASTPCGVDPAALRLPPLYNLRQMRARYNPARNLVIRRVLATATARRFACSRALAQALEANGLPPFEVAHNGVDPLALRAAPEAVEGLRAWLGLAGRRVILFAGRLSVGKGSRPLLAALARVVEQAPDAALLCLTAATPAEQGIDRLEYAELRARHIVQGGWLEGEALAAAYHLADVVVFPSITHDPFGLVNVEAMAAGKPVVATCFGGAPEVVVDGQTGYVVNPLRVDDLADRLARLLRDADLRGRMGAAGYARALAHFTFDRLTRQIEAALAESVADARATR